MAVAEALATLRYSPCLRSLRLNLADNDLGPLLALLYSQLPPTSVAPLFTVGVHITSRESCTLQRLGKQHKFSRIQALPGIILLLTGHMPAHAPAPSEHAKVPTQHLANTHDDRHGSPSQAVYLPMA